MKKFFYIFILLFVLCFQLFAQEKAKDNSYAKKYNEGLFKEAIDAITQIDSSKRSAEEWFFLAQSCFAIKDIKPALAAYSRALQINPDHNGYRLFFARALNSSGDAVLAEENFQKVLSSDSLNIAARYDLGTLYLNSKRYKQAIIHFTKLVNQNNNDYLSRYYTALASFNDNPANPDSNIIPTQLLFSLIANPRYNPARELLALYYYTRGKYRMAMTEYQILTWTKNAHPDIFYRAGQCLEKLKSYTAAIGLYNEANKRENKNANYYSHLGYCYYLTANLDSAIMAYKQAAEIDKENPTTYINLGMIYSAKDSLAQAAEFFKTADLVSSVKQTEFIYNQLGYLFLRMKDYKSAKLYCEKTLSLNENNSTATYNLARVNDDLGQTKTAIKFYESSIKNFKDDSGKQKEFEYAQARIKQLKENR